eukprot:COSAG02_NODE_7632_length_2925_cov_1.298655_3_plen_70_part_00
MDMDEGGTLDRDEIRDLARSLGNQLTDAQLDQAMVEMDEDGSGEVDFEEFFDWYATCASHCGLSHRWLQ